MNNLSKFVHGDDIPTSWQKSRLGSLGDLYSGSTPARSGGANLFGGGISWVKTGDLNNSILLETDETLSQEGFDSCSCRLFPVQTVLVAMYGGFGQIGRTGLLGVPAATNQAITALICKKEKAVPEFVLHWLNTYRFLWREFAGSSRKDPNITKSDIHKFPIALPPLPEQKMIADILGTWDEALEKFDALITTKDRRKQALMQKLLTGKLRFDGFNGRAWKRLHMGDVLERVFRPMKFKGSDSLALVSIRRRLGGLFRRPDVLASQYKTQDLHALRTGDFLISKRQVVHGAWAIVEPEFDGTLVSKEYVIFINRAPEKLDMRFFAWLAQTPRMLRLARVASTGVHIEKLIFDPEVFLREKIRIPQTTEEQAAIAAVLDATDAELRLLRRQRDALDRQKRGLMQRLLTGKIRVNTKRK